MLYSQYSHGSTGHYSEYGYLPDTCGRANSIRIRYVTCGREFFKPATKNIRIQKFLDTCGRGPSKYTTFKLGFRSRGNLKLNTSFRYKRGGPGGFTPSVVIQQSSSRHLILFGVNISNFTLHRFLTFFPQSEIQNEIHVSKF